MRMIPNFTSNIISAFPTPTQTMSNIPKVIETPKPSIDTTIRAVMETPLTPLATVTGVGIMTIFAGSLKLALWILRKNPK